MKTLSRLFLGLTLIFVGTSLRAQNSSASTNDFYFESGEFNYYLDKSADGSSIMKVEETLTAVFPDFNQNHGIERCLVRSYNNVNTLDNPNFTVSRNGISEPFSISSDETYTCLRIGSASSYVHGTQTYKISYTLENVILNPDNSELQELYWDVNGNGWAQSFNSLTATITLSDAIAPAWEKTAYCYIGKFGTSGDAATSRCKIEKDLDKNSITFSSLSAVLPNETMTVDLEFASKSFAVKEPKKSYLLFFFAAGFLGLIVLGIVFWVKAENKVKEKKSLAKSKIISPEFTPMKNMTPAEMAEIYLDPTGSSRVASLLDLAVKKHISLEKGKKKTFGGYHWKIHINNIDHIPTEQKIVLEIINGGKSVKNGDIIEVKSHTATSSLEKLSRSFDTTVTSSLKNKGLLETKKDSKASSSSSAIGVVLIVCFIIFFPFTFIIIEAVFSFFLSSTSGVVYVGAEYILPALFTGFFLYLIIAIVVAVKLDKYKKRTLAGIKASKYMDGLKRYMTLAEKDRIKFLQSVSGADTSPAGIIKLYEKLLPYAVLFKLEDSWLKELNKYYEVEHIESNWATTGAIISASDFRSFTSYTSSSISSSTSYSSSSSGGGGGGGGGFSGGGGGGGGGGGW